MPSGVSSFLLDCMASDLEAGDPLPSIETLCKADTYGTISVLIRNSIFSMKYIIMTTLILTSTDNEQKLILSAFLFV